MRACAAMHPAGHHIYAVHVAPLLALQILGSGPEGVPMRSADYQIVDMIYTKGQRGKLLSMLGTRDEAEWFHMRRSVQSAFSPACIRCVSCKVLHLLHHLYAHACVVYCHAPCYTCNPHLILLPDNVVEHRGQGPPAKCCHLGAGSSTYLSWHASFVYDCASVALATCVECTLC